MNRARYQRVRTILEQVQQEPRDRRRDAVSSLCDDDTSLEREVLSLLDGLEQTSDFLSTPALGDSFRVSGPDDSTAPTIAPGAAVPAPIPRRVGRYSILRLIAEGGMGAVFEARQDRPERIVALKTLRPGLLREESLRRFEMEVRVLARLQHPAIAQIFDAGAAPVSYGIDQAEDTALSVPFFAMEFIHGRPITSHADEAALTIEERVALMIEIAEAVHHGHQKGVIHRDLKPGNLLVDDEDRPKVIDFGVARATDSDLTITASETRQGQLVGTLRYMSPEQCSGDPNSVDLRTDVYSLGVVLYELLSGELPYGDETSSVYDLPRIIRETPPRALGIVNPALRGDLATIVRKALEKEPDRRYQSAHEFAADLRRYLAHEPIAARPPSTIYQLRMFTCRNRALVGGAVAAVLLLVAGIIGTSIGLVRAIEAREDADDAREVADRRRVLAEFESYTANIAAAEGAIRAGRIANAEQRLQRAPEHLRGWEWRHLMARLDRSKLVLRGHTEGVSDVVFSRDGSLVGSAGSFDGTLRLWSTETGEQLLYLEIGHDGYIRMASTPDDQIVAVGTSRSGNVWLHAVEDGTLLRTLEGHQSGIEALAVSADGRLLASGSSDREIHIWEIGTGRLLQTLQGHERHVSALAFNPDGTKLLSGGWDNTAIVWDVESGRRLHTITDHAGRIYSVAWSPDDAYYVTSTDDSEVRVWDAATDESITVFRQHESEIRAVAIRPDGREIASSGTDSIIYRWDPFTGRINGVMLGHRNAVRALTWSRDGAMLGSGGSDHTVRLWDARTTDVRSTPESHGWLFDLAVTRDSREVIYCGTNATLNRMDISTAEVIQPYAEQNLPALGVALSPDEDLMVTGGDDRLLQVFDAASGECLARMRGHTSVIRDVAMHPDGRRVASVSLDRTVRLWDVRNHVLLQTIELDQQTWTVNFDPAGERVIVGLRNGDVVILDAETLDQRHRFAAHSGYIRRIAIHPDGHLLATSSERGEIALWDAATLELRGRIDAHTGAIGGLAFSPDGTRLASGGSDQLIRLWDVERMREVATLHGQNNLIFALDFSADGTHLISIGTANSIRFWDAP